MSTPDIIRPLTDDPNGPQAWVWLDDIHTDRNGTKPLLAGQVEDKWRLSFAARASLVVGGEVVRDPSGREVEIKSPIVGKTIDLADYIHHPEVAALSAMERDVLIRIATGELPPATAPTESTTPRE